MLDGVVKNWRTSLFGLVLVLVGFYVMTHHSEQVETAIGLIIGGLSQLFAKDGATKSEYLKEREELKNEIVCEAERKVRYLTTDELRSELDRRGGAK